uniref:Putative tetratricopeptide repeat protein n=1 Tax=Ixodes ricinus TaxID=34613 RepID=A0A6B0VCH8_IXORI
MAEESQEASEDLKEHDSDENFALASIKNAIEDLYCFRDSYYVNNPSASETEKNGDIEDKLRGILASLDVNEGSLKKSDRAMYHMLRGKALNIRPQFETETYEALSRAVKFNPKLVEAWNELGECYWKKGDILKAQNCFEGVLKITKDKVSLRNLSMLLRQVGETPEDKLKNVCDSVDKAKQALELDITDGNSWKGDILKAQNCFEGVLKITKDKVSLRNLSMLLRQVGETPEDKLKNVCDSVDKAKQALELDITDGNSWYILGNAYLALYFSGSQNAKTVQEAMSAYSRALEDPKMKYSSDLYHNFAVALKHQEDFQGALQHLDKAAALDPSYSNPKEKSQNLLKYLTTLDKMISNKGDLKPRKVKTLLASLKPHHLGPFRDHATIKAKKFKELVPGKNPNCVLAAKVVCNLDSEERFPLTLCTVDEDAVCFAVTIYNLAEGKGFLIGDTIVIPDPLVCKAHIEYKDHVISFSNIRVDSPLALVVNGRVLNPSSQAPISLHVEIKRE